MKFANTIKSNIRMTDTIYRFGDEEFVVLTYSISINKDKHLVQKIRLCIKDNHFLKSYTIIVSIGAAKIEKSDTIKSWFSRADNALYLAKSSGRNQGRSKTQCKYS